MSTRMPHREDNSMGGLPLFNAGIQNQRGCRKRQRIEPGTPGRKPSTFQCIDRFCECMHCGLILTVNPDTA